MSRKFSVVTTFNQAGYNKYGSRMIDTFLLNWPEEVHLYVYAEDCAVAQTAPNLTVYDFHSKVPELVAFKEKYKKDLRANGKLATGPADKKGKQPGIGFRWDAIRFSHKVYAVCDIGMRVSDVLMWMDADMVCHTPMPIEFLNKMFPQDTGIAFLGRKKKFTECGLYAMNCSNSGTFLFLQWFKEAYNDAENGIFTMEEWNDCWVFDRIRDRMREKVSAWKQLDWNESSLQGEGHPLINTEWGKYLDHLKGNRKDTGRSLDKDLIRPREENYWSS